MTPAPIAEIVTILAIMAGAMAAEHRGTRDRRGGWTAKRITLTAEPGGESRQRG